MLGVGGALGLPLAGVVAEHADFHVLFWITGGVGLATFLATVAIVPESPSRTGGRVDVVGAVLLAGGLVTLLLPLAQGRSWGWASARTIGLLVAAVVLAAVFVRVELRMPTPLVDIAATSRRPIVLTNIASLLFGFALFASFIGTASYVEAPTATGYGFGSSIIVGGLCLLPSGLLMLAPRAGRRPAHRVVGRAAHADARCADPRGGLAAAHRRDRFAVGGRARQHDHRRRNRRRLRRDAGADQPQHPAVRDRRGQRVELTRAQPRQLVGERDRRQPARGQHGRRRRSRAAVAHRLPVAVRDLRRSARCSPPELLCSCRTANRSNEAIAAQATAHASAGAADRCAPTVPKRTRGRATAGDTEAESGRLPAERLGRAGRVIADERAEGGDRRRAPGADEHEPDTGDR